jgi:hypothetical protein
VTEIAVLGGDRSWSVARLLRQAGLTVIDAEPPPAQTPAPLAERHGFGLASVRGGRLGHLRQLRQLVEAALGGTGPRAVGWPQPDGTVVDGLRADVDPCGLADGAEVAAYRAAHLAAVRHVVLRAQVLIICPATLSGLVDPADGTVYPTPPAGVALPGDAALVPYRSGDAEAEADLVALLASLKAVNSGIRLRVVVRPGGADPAACAEEAALRALAAGWSQRIAGVAADPVFDHLLERATEVEAGTDRAQRLGAVLAGLLGGDDLVDLLSPEGLAQGAVAAAPPLDKAARKERRKNREARRQKQKAPSVVCEDELLEAFS